jgi:hypothetical protein
VEPFSYQLWFAVRYVHVVSVAMLTGGAIMVCLSGLFGRDTTERRLIYDLAPAYEWTFWSVGGITVATGISNLGLKGEGLLGPETTWGTALLVKLVAVFLLMALSLVRTDFMIRCRRTPPGSVRTYTTLAAFYGLTAATLLVTIWLGLGLAHGRY